MGGQSGASLVLSYKLGAFSTALHSVVTTVQVTKSGAPSSLLRVIPGALLVHFSAQGGGRWFLQSPMHLLAARTSVLPSPLFTWQVGPVTSAISGTLPCAPTHISTGNVLIGHQRYAQCSEQHCSHSPNPETPQMSTESLMENKVWCVVYLHHGMLHSESEQIRTRGHSMDKSRKHNASERSPMQRVTPVGFCL